MRKLKSVDDQYRLCTSVGIYQGYDNGLQRHKISVRNSNCAVERGMKRMTHHLLDEFQFIVWFSCHGEIVQEDELFEIASLLWETSTSDYKRPLRKCFNELIEMELIYMGESMANELVLYEVGTRIQPYVISIWDCNHLQKTVRTIVKALKCTVFSLFLSTEERRIIRYFRKNIGATFMDYVKDAELMRSGKYLELGVNINNLLSGGYIYPVGWSSSSLPQSLV